MQNYLRIMTYNIHRCIGGDRKISPKRISEVIAGHQPDVVALQEVDFGQMRPAQYDQAAIIAEYLNLQYLFPSASAESSHFSEPRAISLYISTWLAGIANTFTVFPLFKISPVLTLKLASSDVR